MLREGSWEAHAVCSHSWLKRLVLAMPLVMVSGAIALSLTDHAEVARGVFFLGLGMSPLVAAILLPINTPSRGRVFRYVKWITMTGAFTMLLGPDTLKWSWLLISCLWPVAWTEWTRASIRRKLPIKAWPRHLYL